MTDVMHVNPKVEEMVRGLLAALPPVFARRDLPKYFGSSLPVGTIANLGKAGPPYIRRGRHAIYERTAFLGWYRSWLAGEITPAEHRTAPSSNS